MEIAYFFPGQASQKIGMGKDLYDNFSEARRVFLMGNKFLGRDLTSLMFEGSQGELTKTINCQPAIFLTNLAYFEVLKNKLPPFLTLGHSVGELTSLAVSGALSEEKALDLVRIRAEAMSDCVKDLSKDEGACRMAVIIGGKFSEIDKVCGVVYSSLKKVVQVANYNSEDQIVISGNNDAVLRVMEILEFGGVKKTMCLGVEAAFHSDLMKPAEAIMEEALKKVEFGKVELPYIANFTGELVNENNPPEEIKKLLVDQICGMVLWKDSIMEADKLGTEKFLECGYGKTMENLVKRDYKNLKIFKKSDYLV